jgi:carbon monoxide dehydrogenase subunit G
VTRVEGERTLDAPPERVFAALTNPDVVAAAIPVVRSHRIVDDDHWEAKIKAPLPFAPSVTVQFEVLDRRAPQHATIRSHGGGARVRSSFDLAAEGEGRTRVVWWAEVELSGLLAAFGGAGLEPLARRAADRVLDRVGAAAAADDG